MFPHSDLERKKARRRKARQIQTLACDNISRLVIVAGCFDYERDGIDRLRRKVVVIGLIGLLLDTCIDGAAIGKSQRRMKAQQAEDGTNNFQNHFRSMFFSRM